MGLLPHGLAEHGGRYPDAGRAPASAGYASYAYHARGHGRFGGRRAYFDHFGELVTDLHTVTAMLGRPAHKAPVFLLGYNLGGASAVAAARQYQYDLPGLIVIGCALGRGLAVWRRLFCMPLLLSARSEACPASA